MCYDLRSIRYIFAPQLGDSIAGRAVSECRSKPCRAALEEREGRFL